MNTPLHASFTQPQVLALALSRKQLAVPFFLAWFSEFGIRCSISCARAWFSQESKPQQSKRHDLEPDQYHQNRKTLMDTVWEDLHLHAGKQDQERRDKRVSAIGSQAVIPPYD